MDKGFLFSNLHIIHFQTIYNVMLLITFCPTQHPLVASDPQSNLLPATVVYRLDVGWMMEINPLADLMHGLIFDYY